MIEKPPAPAPADEVDETLEAKRLNRAIAKLPDEASAKEEWRWLSNHAFWTREEFRRVTVEDILRPDHGPAPSKSAAQRLRRYAAHPDEFFEADMKLWQKEAAAPERPQDKPDELPPEYLDNLGEALSLLEAIADTASPMKSVSQTEELM
jgi:hypothetical protein